MIDERTLVANLKSYIDDLSAEGFHAEVEEHSRGEGK
jgi:hypothetical protein